MKFDIIEQSVVCGFCNNRYDPSELIDDGLSKDIDPGTISLVGDAGTVDGEEYNAYSCNSCGGEIYTEPTTSATICPFCGNPVAFRGRLTGLLMPDRIIPFKKDKVDALEGLDAHLKGNFIPRGFKDDRKLEEVKGLYVPYWVYDADLRADIEYLGMKENILLPGKEGDVVERKYYRVTRKGTIGFDHIPADASKKMPDDLMESIEPFDYGDAVDFNTSYLAGFVADRYDVEQEDASERVRKRMSEEVDDRFRSTASGYTTLTLKRADLETLNSNTDYVLYPVWMFNIDWNGKKYTYAMNGQTGKVVGNIPLDKKKLSLVTISMYLAAMAVAFIIVGREMKYDDMVDFMTVIGSILLLVCYSTTILPRSWNRSNLSMVQEITIVRTV